MEDKQTAEKLTAMEQLIHWIDSDCTPMDCVMKAKELLAMEKEQIEKAFHHSIVAMVAGKFLSPEQYYNETYGKHT